MSTEHFFDDPLEQSLVKSEIVSKYFWAWAKVITSTLKKRFGGKLAYIDLFAGPGRYEDNTKSTPLLVLETAINDPDLSQMLVTMFNDKDPNNVRSLESAIKQLPGIENLKYQPQILNIEIDKAIVDQFKNMKLVPTLLFVDPWGYKGLSVSLVDSVLKNWGCDCIFFFNYNRINMGLHNEKVRDHMDSLFGEQRANELRVSLSQFKPHKREMIIVEELSQAFKDLGYQFVLPFRFKREASGRPSHHLIFVTKDFVGYNIMKSIMAKASSHINQGVASFEYNNADKITPLLFELNRPIDDLAQMLSHDFEGKTLPFIEIYKQHSVDKPYIARNYKDVLMQLEAEGKITANPDSTHRKKGTFADNVVVTFQKSQE